VIMLQTFWINTSCVETIQSFTIVILLKRDNCKPKGCRRLQKCLKKRKNKAAHGVSGAPLPLWRVNFPMKFPKNELIVHSDNKQHPPNIPQNVGPNENYISSKCKPVLSSSLVL
jgi:hypothetical protein